MPWEIPSSNGQAAAFGLCPAPNVSGPPCVPASRNFAAIAQEAPHVQLQVRRLDALFSVPEADLCHGAIDLAIGFFPDARSLEGGTSAETLIEEHNAVVFRRHHPLAQGPFTLERYAEAVHAAVIFRTEPWGLIDQELAARGLRRRLQYASPHFLAVCDVLRQSDLIATLPAALGRHPGLVTRPVPLALPTFTTRVIWRDHHDEALAWLRQRLRHVAASSGRSQGSSRPSPAATQ